MQHTACHKREYLYNKQLKRRVMWGRILTKFFALFGITLTAVACYGVPYEDFEPKPNVPEDTYLSHGKVVDSSHKPIQGIRVTIGADECITDSRGWFDVGDEGDNVIVFSDIDGTENGGEFREHTIRLLDTGYTYFDEVVLYRVDEEQNEPKEEA